MSTHNLSVYAELKKIIPELSLTLVTPTSNFQPVKLLDQDVCYKFTYLIANSADPDQLASKEAN